MNVKNVLTSIEAFAIESILSLQLAQSHTYTLRTTFDNQSFSFIIFRFSVKKPTEPMCVEFLPRFEDCIFRDHQKSYIIVVV